MYQSTEWEGWMGKFGYLKKKNKQLDQNPSNTSQEHNLSNPLEQHLFMKSAVTMR